MPPVAVNRGHYAVGGLLLLVALISGVVMVNVRVGR